MEQQYYIDRPPRIQPEYPQGVVNIPEPPAEERRAGRPFLQLLLPLVTIGGYLLISIFGRGRSLLFMIPMGISAIASVGVAIYSRLREADDQGGKEAAYAERLVELHKELQVKQDMQRRFYLYNHPDPGACLSIAAHAHRIPFQTELADFEIGSRLWERRVTDQDFGALRIGMGSQPATFEYLLGQKGGDTESRQYRDALRLAEDARFVDQIPVTIPLWASPSDDQRGRTVAKHAIGITGTHRSAIYGFMQASLVQLATFHAPKDLRIQIVGVDAAKEQWRWASTLPHCANRKGADLIFETEQDREGDGDRNRLAHFLKGLRKLYEERKMRLADGSGGLETRLPFNILVVDLLPLIDERSLLSEVESDPVISLLLNEGSKVGGGIFVLVPQRQKIPSSCQAVLNITVDHVDQERLDTHPRQKIQFRYAETGVNTPRFLGTADQTTDSEHLARFAQHLAPLRVRQSYGADLPRGVMMLDMLKVETIDELRELTRQKWGASRRSDLADWLKVTLGAVSGGDFRTLQFAAHADGVHGLIAGSTGSGKSELLMTMIIGLALNYDPTIVNFVLVDFKGGAAFEPFRHLPHCVDIVTNLAGSGVERMFAAITAELNRRQAINVATDSKHIVHYRERSLHHPPYGEPVDIKENRYQTAPYPHLFIFIDEFAEMIADNPDYKAQLDSITRLGRALGVTLILAAQRPTGVTDQMRANIKFRIALRVETREESGEVLRRPDAAYLPNDIPGRGYLQVGNDNIEMIQVAWSGSEYRGRRSVEKPKVIWHDRPRRSDVGDGGTEDELPKVYEVMVDMMGQLASEISIPQQTPWPTFLPSLLYLNSSIDLTYVSQEMAPWFGHPNQAKGRLGLLTPLFTGVDRWLGDDPRWREPDWALQAMRPVIGIVDNPYQAETLPLRIDLRRGHVVVFGGSGWGKTTFLRTLITVLTTTLSPEALHLYILDFGGRQLYQFQDRLPHLGAIISPDEEDRVKRLVRKLGGILDERKKQISGAGAGDLYEYNQKFPHLALPAVLVVIDNFAELRESFESLVPLLTPLLRESRAYGLHFVVTATLPNVIGGKLFNLFSERYTLKLAEAAEYVTVVGRGAQPIGDIAGRGLVNINRRPLAFQVALPLDETHTQLDDDGPFDLLLERIREMGDHISQDRLPDSIQSLPSQVLLGNLLVQSGPPVRGKRLISIGINDADLSPFKLDLQSQGPHLVGLGPPNSGKTTFLRTFILSLCATYRPGEIEIILIDLQQRLFRYGGQRSLDELPHVALLIDDEDLLENFYDPLAHGVGRLNDVNGPRDIFVIIDNYSFFDEAAARDRQLLTDLGRLARRHGTDGLHFVACGGLDMLRGGDDLRRQLKAPGLGIAFNSLEAVQTLDGRVPRSMMQIELPQGRSFVVKSGRTRMLQLASPYAAGEQASQQLDHWVARICERFPQPVPRWELSESLKTEVRQPARKANASSKLSRSPASGKPKPKETEVPDGVDIEKIKRELQIMGGWSDMMINSLSPSELIDTARALEIIPNES